MSTGITSPGSARPKMSSSVSRSARYGSPGPKTRTTTWRNRCARTTPPRWPRSAPAPRPWPRSARRDAQDLLHVLGLLGAAGEKSKAAFDIAKKAANGRTPRYWRPTDPPFQVPGSDIHIYALGPPDDAKLIRKVLPSKSNPETYELALNGGGLMPLG